MTRPTAPHVQGLAAALLLLSGPCRAAGEMPAPTPAEDPETRLVRLLLAENLSQRDFSFAAVAAACSGKRVEALDRQGRHRRILTALDAALTELLPTLSREDSPVRQLRRINEASRFFEDGLMASLNAVEGLRCSPPPTRAGQAQRSGYPDLRILDETNGAVLYLDPKLVERGSETSTLRTFYFEPKTDTLKITEDAAHLLVGIEHDGKAGQWTFLGWRITDLSTLRVRLKAEFQASNADLYRDSELSAAPAVP
jgi:hypothetical protein